jgi:hypothetical protein
MSIPGSEINKVIPAMEVLLSNMNPEKCVEYLKPYYDNWRKRRTKDGKNYSKTNCAWLYDFAIAGMDDGQQPKNEITPQGGFYL